jgi:hypothetical protein
MASHEETVARLVADQRERKGELARTIAQGGRQPDDDDRPVAMRLSKTEATLIESLRRQSTDAS